MMRHWDKILFAVGCGLLLFGYGIAVGKYELFPFAYIKAAQDALATLQERILPQYAILVPSPRRGGGVTRWERGATQDGLTLIALGGTERDGAVLVDMEGHEVHRWSLRFSEVWPDAEHVAWQGPDSDIFFDGMRLFPNGDLLFNWGGATFPPGGGLVLIDKDSRIKWKLARNTHHDLDLLPDGRIVVLWQRLTAEGVPACARHFKPPYMEDGLMLVSPDGEVLEELSLFDAICRSPYWTVLARRLSSDDPFHTNTVEVVTPEKAARFPMAEPYDYIVSLRNIHAIVVVSARTKLVSWLLLGHFVEQHDPDLLENGNLLVYDNRGGEPSRGGARILEIDPKTGRVVWQYQGEPDDPFYAPFLGKQAKLANGNVLISAGRQGRVFEVTGDAAPRVVWEYIHQVATTEDGGVNGYVGDAARFSRAELPFLGPP